jgi:hypothetical protein
MSTYQGDQDPKNEKGKETEKEKPIPIDGFQQIVDMLKIADPAFRESLLRRLAVKDKDLANSLRRDLGSLDL